MLKLILVLLFGYGAINAITIFSAYGVVMIYKFAKNDQPLVFNSKEVTETLSRLITFLDDMDEEDKYIEYYSKSQKAPVEESKPDRHINTSDDSTQRYIDRILELKKEVEEDSFEYDESIEESFRQLSQYAESKIDGDYPAGIEVITNEYEKDKER